MEDSSMITKNNHVFLMLLIVILLALLLVRSEVLLPKDNLPIFLSYSTGNQSLFDEIKTKSSDYFEAPEDAYIDRVWKKTPGRNGIAVNIEESYERMRAENKFNENLLVFEEIQPEVSLS